MKKFFIYICIIINALIMNAQDIVLPKANTKGGFPFNETVASRRSIREFDTTRKPTDQQLSDLLWCAVGFNRPAESKRCNPTALNKQEIDLYVFTDEAVYFYNPEKNILEHKAGGDHRKLVAGTEAFSQEFVTDAPVSVVIVADISKLAEAGDKAILMAACDAGIVSENINLYCSAHGLATVPRATMDAEGIVSLLKLDKNYAPLLNNPIGYEKR